MLTVEREISSIETANINKETLDAMKNAQQAMKKIHGGLTIDKVDQTMEDLREQHAIGEEIAEALTQGNTGNMVDEDELDDELAELQQEELDNKMLKTGTVPVSDQVQRLPSVGNQESEYCLVDYKDDLRGSMLTSDQSKAKPSGSRKTTKRKSCGSYKRRWQCDAGVSGFLGARPDTMGLWALMTSTAYSTICNKTFPFTVVLQDFPVLHHQTSPKPCQHFLHAVFPTTLFSRSQDASVKPLDRNSPAQQQQIPFLIISPC